jgi:polysaccharide export outer membrane protein
MFNAGSPRSLRYLLPYFCSLLLLSAGLNAQAQFSGPALSAPAQGNSVQTPTTDLALLNPAAGEVTIVPGDVLSIRLFGSATYAPTVVVGSDGTVDLPLIGQVPVGGLTSTQASKLIAARLSDAQMYVNPQVQINVTVSAGQFATVSGEVHAIIPIAGSRRLLEVLAAAGTLPPTASHVITILRPGVQKPIVVDLGTDPLRSAQANVPILPRDIIIISRVGVVYMLGAFKAQGAIPLAQTSPLTLIEAAALSGGPTFVGQYNDLRIIRTVGLERKLVKVDIKKVFAGKAPDPILQADDIVYLPTNLFKTILRSDSIGAVTGIVSLMLVAFR